MATTRKHRQQRRLEHQRLRLAEHAAPGRLGRLRAQAQVRQRGLGQDGNGKADGGLHDQHRGNVGQHMLHRDAEAAFAGRPRGQHELARPDGVGRRAGDARKGGDVVDADGDDGVHNAGAEHGGHHDGRQDGREGKAEVRQPHDQLFHPAAARSGQQAQRRAHGPGRCPPRSRPPESMPARPPAAAMPRRAQRRRCPASAAAPGGSSFDGMFIS
jgi:hypothetical protein